MIALTPLFASKTRPPALPRPYLSRPRLLASLRQRSRRRATVVVGPAGAGKTTLLADFVRGASPAFSWYTVDDLDDSAVALLHGIAIATGCRKARRLSPLGYLAVIVDALGKPPDPRVLVLDDLHRLTDASAVKALADLIRYLPQSARLILVGRSLPDGLRPILDWLAAHGQVAHLGWEHFRLSSDERAQAVTVFKAEGAGGWILGWAHPEGLDLARYLHDEVLAPLGSDVIRHLARLSVLPSFDPSLAAAVAGLDDQQTRRLLERVRDETPLLERLGDSWYRFSETARSVLSDTLPAEEARAARQAAGQALRTIDPQRSAECFLACGDHVEAARSLAGVDLAEWLSQSPNALHEVLRQLSAEAVASQPRLLLARAWATFVWEGTSPEAAAVLSQLDRRLEDLELRFWHLYLATRLQIALGDKQSTATAYGELRQVLDQIRRDASIAPRQVAAMLCRAAMIERFVGDPGAAIATARTGLALAELSPSGARVECQLLHHVLATFLTWDGDYQAADRHLNAALALAKEASDVAERAALWHGQAAVARCRGEFVRALGLLEQALREPLLPTREQMILTLQAAHALADVQDFSAAARRYRLVASVLRHGDRDGCFSRALCGLVICCSFLGLAAEAETTLAQLSTLEGDSAHYDALIAQGVYALAQSTPERAASFFARASQIRATIAGIQDTWQAVLLLAQAHLRAEQPAVAERVIREFLATHAQPTLPAVGLWVVRPIRSILDSLNQQQPHPSVDLLLRLAGADPAPPRLIHAVAAIARAPASTGHRVEVRLFGPPRLIVDGAEVKWPYGLRHKAIELFWYSALHPDGATREQMVTDLFPEREPTAAMKQLQVAISDLRAALWQLIGVPGSQILVRQDDGSLRLRLDATPGGIVLETRRLTALAESVRSTRRARLPDSVPELFRGELLAGLTAEWLEPIRRYWTAVYLRTLGTLAERYARQGMLQQAIRCRELILQIDPTVESAHLDLMRLYSAAGDRQAVESQMWLYRRVARDELDTEPGEDVEELYRRLMASQQ